jgi:hypothetical protein
MPLTPQDRESVAYAPELAVIYALRAVADATCAALAAALPGVELEPPHTVEYALATQLYETIQRLRQAADAYCQHVAELRIREPNDFDDTPF